MYGIFFFYAVRLNSGSMQSGRKCTQWGEIISKILISCTHIFDRVLMSNVQNVLIRNQRFGGIRFWKSNFNFGNAKTFLDMIQKVKFTNKKLILVQSKFWHFQIEIGFPKHRLEIQKVFRL